MSALLFLDFIFSVFYFILLTITQTLSCFSSYNVGNVLLCYYLFLFIIRKQNSLTWSGIWSNIILRASFFSFVIAVFVSRTVGTALKICIVPNLLMIMHILLCEPISFNFLLIIFIRLCNLSTKKWDTFHHTYFIGYSCFLLYHRNRFTLFFFFCVHSSVDNFITRIFYVYV